MFYHFIFLFSLIISAFIYVLPFSPFKELFVDKVNGYWLLILLIIFLSFYVFNCLLKLKGKGVKLINAFLVFLLIVVVFFYRYDKFEKERQNLNLPFKASSYLFRGVITEVNEFKGDYFQVKLKIQEIRNIKNKENNNISDLIKEDSDIYTLVNFNYKLTNVFPGNVVAFSPYFIVDVFENKYSSYKNYLLEKNIKFIVYSNNQTVQVENSHTSIISKIRKKIFEKHKKYIDQSSYGLAYALITGDKNFINNQIKENFRQTGTYHFLAVSGMHAGILIAIVFFCLRLFNFKKNNIFLIILLLVLPLYLLITNFQISIIRTYIMLCFFIIMRTLDKERSLSLALILTFILVVLVSPEEIHSLSFQLSFSAVWGICLALDFIQKYSIKNTFLSLIIVSLGAQFSTSPILIYYFGYFNYLSVLYNILIAFLIPLIFIYSLIVAINPFDLLNVIIGKFITFLSEITFTVLEIFKFELSSYYHPYLKENFFLNFTIFLLLNGLAFLIIKPSFFLKKPFLK